MIVAVDVCVIGAGAAGLALARELSATKLEVCLLESGAASRAPNPDPLYEVRSSGLHIANDSRVRAFGGTTTMWSGRWKHLDPIDFEPRGLISGWPLSHAALEPYRERADRLAGFAAAPHATSFLNSAVVIPTAFRSQPAAERDWSKTLGTSLADNITLHLQAHVVRIEQRAGSVRRVVACNPGDKRELAIAPRVVVLAAGGIENARLLLLSELGNRNDQVGRYFMDHPKAKLGVLETYDPLNRSTWEALIPDSAVYLGFRLADAIQHERRVLNSHVLLQPMFEREIASRIARRFRQPTTCRIFEIRNYLEQAPDPENRVVLDGETDGLGLRKANVRWTIGELDRATMVVFHQLLRRELQRARIGELESPLLHGGELEGISDASHHMGTTRMGVDPTISVVDTNCRVHDLDNLFVAGSSVFPTGGHANPTAMIVALAIRLADHLKGAL